MATELAEWTILVYIAAHNNLDGCGTRSRDQILSVGSSDKVKLAVLFDSWQGGGRTIAAGLNTPALHEPHNRFDSGDPAQLLATAQWAFEKCPAKRYGLVLWSHGTGYWNQDELKKIAKKARGEMANLEEIERDVATRSTAFFASSIHEIMKVQSPDERAILFDDGTGHSVDTLELARVCAELQAFTGQPLDLLGMDTCLMATLEVAYELRGHVRTLVASEELVPGRSWPYDIIFPKLLAAPEMSAHDLARLVVQDFVAYYRDNPPALNSGDVTKVALDLTKIEQVVGPMKALAGVLRQHMPSAYAALHAVQYAAYLKETFEKRRNPKFTKFGYHLWDVNTLATGLVAGAEQPQVKQAAEAVVASLQPGGAVLAEAHEGEWFAGIGGVSVYMAPPKLPVSIAYGKLALAKHTGWGEMLKAFQREAGTSD